METFTEEIRRKTFKEWFGKYGPIPFKYEQALESPHQVVALRKHTPSMGRIQAEDLDLTKFPPDGKSIFSFTRRSEVRALFDETKSFRVGDDGAMHTAIGYYALWLRLVYCKEWLNEPFWDSDCASDGSATGKTRMATLQNKGFDFLKELENRKATYTMDKHLTAIRTKPFVLLAGISGTGKSRLVRQLARGCCPAGHDLGKDSSGKVNAAKKPGNFEMIPVRPNWHDSTELMGYVTRLTDDSKPKYVIKPFVKFLVKAAIYKDVPFFLCLDEMNLAPVEQYFAEYLSVVETRKKDGNDIVSDVLVNFDQPEIDVTKTVQELMADWIAVAADGTVSEKIAGAKTVYDAIVADKGVRIPKNFVVMGTVNMDETTCSFSRKVLDRAMTFELNEVDMDEGLAADNAVPYGVIPPSAAFATSVEGCDFYTANKDVCDTIKTYLQTVNKVLDGTPFKFAYRSRNEIMLYCVERMQGGIVTLPQALDEATSMKVLSRIEGDEPKLMYVGDEADFTGKNLLQVLQVVIPEALKVANGGNVPANCELCAQKLKFMERRLEGGFTNFFV